MGDFRFITQPRLGLVTSLNIVVMGAKGNVMAAICITIGNTHEYLCDFFLFFKLYISIHTIASEYCFPGLNFFP